VFLEECFDFCIAGDFNCPVSFAGNLFNIDSPFEVVVFFEADGSLEIVNNMPLVFFVDFIEFATQFYFLNFEPHESGFCE
jgi:hypothetical protein